MELGDLELNIHHMPMLNVSSDDNKTAKLTWLECVVLREGMQSSHSSYQLLLIYIASCITRLRTAQNLEQKTLVEKNEPVTIYITTWPLFLLSSDLCLNNFAIFRLSQS